MGIEIKKTGKNTYYRKDGNKMGGRKEKQEMLNISIKYFEKDFEERDRHSSLIPTGWVGINKMLSGGIKRGEITAITAFCAIPDDKYRNNMALGAMLHVDRNKVVKIGMEHEFDHTDRLAEEFKHHMDYIPLVTGDGVPHGVIVKMKDIPKRMNMLYGGERQGFVMIDEIPYNTMDEFDRPEFYRRDIEVVSDGCGSIYPKNPEDVLSEQFKIDIINTHQKDVTNAINNMINVNKAYSMVVDNEGRQLYPETNMGLEGVSIKNAPDDLKEEWYMKKSKITLIIPDWMIEPKDVYTYMSMTQISDEEREDTLSKRLDKLLEGTYYKYNIEEKMVPDQERTMLYKITIVKDNGGPCLCNLENTTFYSKLEALAESYYILRKNGLKTTEELKDVRKENNIGRGNIVPEIHTISKAELLFLLEKEMIDGSSYQVLQSTNEEGTETYYHIEYNIGGKKSDSEKELLCKWCKTEYEALSKFYTYICKSKGK